MADPRAANNRLAEYLSPRTRVVLLTLGDSDLALPAVPRPRFEDHLFHLLLASELTPELRREGRRDAGRFRKLAPHDLASRLSRSRSVPRGLATYVALLDQARAAVHESPPRAATLASVAVAVATLGPLGTAVPSARALALAAQGNALRAEARLRDAAPCFAAARRSLPPDAPLWIAGEVAALEGSFLIDSRRLGVAEVRLGRAVAAFRTAGDAAAAGRALLKLAHRHSLAGLPARAAAVVREALDLLHPIADARAFLYALHNLALELVDLGEGPAAAALVDLIQPLYARLADPHTANRRAWLEARVARALRRLDQAEAGLRSTLAGFQRAEQAFDAALVGLDLADLLLSQHRAREVQEIAASLVPLFEDQAIHREAAAAVVLFHRAAAEERLDLAWVERFREFLLCAQVDRSARFREPAELLTSPP